ncbi:MAG TPA: GNAT family N-acetyltransferase [Gemmobacter sp.]|nr:GNAT family N-acetyltransferase [Gemmobacter sp.]
MIVPACPEHVSFVHALWTADCNSAYLDPPDPGEIEALQAEGNLLLWMEQNTPSGFAVLTEWLPDVWGLREFAVQRPGQGTGQGRSFLEALLIEVFDHRHGHRLGLDCTADNTRAIRFFQKAGFVQEGVWRECWKRSDGHWVDCIFYALLAREWREERAKPSGRA